MTLCVANYCTDLVHMLATCVIALGCSIQYSQCITVSRACLCFIVMSRCLYVARALGVGCRVNNADNWIAPLDGFSSIIAALSESGSNSKSSLRKASRYLRHVIGFIYLPTYLLWTLAVLSVWNRHQKTLEAAFSECLSAFTRTTVCCENIYTVCLG